MVGWGGVEERACPFPEWGRCLTVVLFLPCLSPVNILFGKGKTKTISNPSVKIIMKTHFLILFFFDSIGVLISEHCASEAGTLPLEPHPQHFFALFFR